MNKLSLIILGAAILVQSILAPALSLFGIIPNILLLAVLIMAGRDTSPFFFIAAFCSGFILDCMGNGPLGAYALLFMLGASVSRQVLRLMDNGTLFMNILVVATSVCLIQISSVFILAGTGMLQDLLGALLFYALPASLYDCALAVILLPLAYKFLPTKQSSGQDKLLHVQLR